MSKKDIRKEKLKKEKERIKEKQNNPDSETSKNVKRQSAKHKDAKFLIIMFSITILLCITGVYLYGLYIVKNKGFASSKEAATAFVTALSNDDVTKMHDAFATGSPNEDQKVKELYDGIHENKDNIEMFLEDMYISVTPNNEYFKSIKNATASEDVYIEIPATYKTDQYIFYVVMKYNIKTVKITDKWFIYEIDEDEAVPVNAIPNPDYTGESTATETDAE